MNNLKYILDYYKADFKKAAIAIFPNNNFPVLALNRVIKQGAPLNTRQLEALADFLQVNIEQLFILSSVQPTDNDCILFYRNKAFVITPKEILSDGEDKVASTDITVKDLLNLIKR